MKKLSFRYFLVFLFLFFGLVFSLFSSASASVFSSSTYDFLICSNSAGVKYVLSPTRLFPTGELEYLFSTTTTVQGVGGLWNVSDGSYIAGSFGSCVGASQSVLASSGNAFNLGSGSVSGTTTVELSTHTFDIFYLFFGIILMFFGLVFIVWYFKSREK